MRKINRAEIWERAYEAFQEINFSAWDYNTIKESILDYLKLYYPEDFNDFIESSELVAIIETFAYVGELMAYRSDLNAHENFLTTAQRRESVLRLAKMLSYSVSRNIPARGLVKITSITTTERVIDSRGNNLANRQINWNDPLNVNWKEQFILVLNRVLQQQFGSVLPSDRVQVQDVLFELYALQNSPTANGVLPYTISVSGNTYPMEAVPSTLTSFGPIEKRPQKDQTLSVLYLSDGLGDTSENTGFFLFTKQGTLQKTSTRFDGVLPNQTFDVPVNNCNETDVWLNNVDEFGNIIEGDDVTSDRRLGEWEKVDIANSQNVIFNTNPNRNKYEIETLDNDRFRVIFGDGKFAAIPSGNFDIWYRVSANEELVIPTSSIQNKSVSFQYRDQTNNEHTFKVSFSLVDPIQNAAPAEDLERIRRIAPSVYYTQDRMVNGRDYNEFMLQDNTILKIRSINRTFAGDSKFIYWKDPREYYENVKMFGDDLVLYLKSITIQNNTSGGQLPAPDGGANVNLINAVILNLIQPIFETEDWFTKSILQGVPPNNIRKTFRFGEALELQQAIQILINNRPETFYMIYDVAQDLWEIDTSNTEPADWWIMVTSNADGSWSVRYEAKRLIAHSNEINFWVSNKDEKVIEYDTLRSRRDQIVILRANQGTDGCVLPRNFKFSVLRQEVIEAGENTGLESINDLSILPEDEDNDNLPDFFDLSYIIGPNDYVYFKRECTTCEWVYQPPTPENVEAWENDEDDLWKRERGVEGINFLWMHRTPRYHLIDPAASNIIDMFVMSRGYYASIRRWLSGFVSTPPEPPTPFQLRNDYGYLLESKMISDTVVLHPGKVKIIIGEKARDELRATIKIIRSTNREMTSNQIKAAVVDAVNEFFDINRWEFGETFYFTELSSYIHSKMPSSIDSVVLVPKFDRNVFGDLYQVFAKEDEIIQPSMSVNDVEIVESLNPRVLKQTL